MYLIVVYVDVDRDVEVGINFYAMYNSVPKGIHKSFISTSKAFGFDSAPYPLVFGSYQVLRISEYSLNEI